MRARERIPDNKPQWLWDFLENYQDGKSALLMNQYHGMCDGISMVTFTAFLNNKITESMFPEMRTIPFIAQVLYYSTYPVWVVLAWTANKIVK